MERKHAMLFMDLDMQLSARQTNDHNAALAALGCPVEVPPPYETNFLAMTMQQPMVASNVGEHPQSYSNKDCMYVYKSVRPVIYEQPMQTMVATMQGTTVRQQQQQHLNPLSVITSTTTTMQQQQNQKLGPHPCTILCPACATHSSTRMTHTPNSRTHAFAVTLCLMGWCCCACCLPYAMKSCRTGNHYCAECNTFLGAYYPFDTRIHD